MTRSLCALLQVLLTPIQETEGGTINSHHHHRNQLAVTNAGTKALAQAVLAPGLGPIGQFNPMGAVTLTGTPVPVTIAQPILLSASPSLHRPVRSSAPPRATVTEVGRHSGSEEEGAGGSAASTTPPGTPPPAAPATTSASSTAASATAPVRSTANSLAPPSTTGTAERRTGTAERRTGAPSKRGEVYV